MTVIIKVDYESCAGGWQIKIIVRMMSLYDTIPATANNIIKCDKKRKNIISMRILRGPQQTKRQCACQKLTRNTP